ncbi:MAG: hypothetical protein ABIN96_13460 [Rubrivivax sp.]
MTAPILGEWPPQFTTGWGRQMLCIGHRLHEQPLFSLPALAELIERCPPAHYGLVQTSGQDDARRRWREGTIGGVPGLQVIDAIGAHSLWLNLRDVATVDPRYGELLQAAYAELAQHVPDFVPRDLKMGILIPSPGATVHYHCDLPGQALWQIAGRKRVFVYPATAPYLHPEGLENIAYSGFEFKLPARIRVE